MRLTRQAIAGQTAFRGTWRPFSCGVEEPSAHVERRPAGYGKMVQRDHSLAVVARQVAANTWGGSQPRASASRVGAFRKLPDACKPLPSGLGSEHARHPDRGTEQRTGSSDPGKLAAESAAKIPTRRDFNPLFCMPTAETKRMRHYCSGRASAVRQTTASS